MAAARQPAINTPASRMLTLKLNRHLTALAEYMEVSDQHGNRLVKCTGCLIDDIVRTVMAAAVKYHQLLFSMILRITDSCIFLEATSEIVWIRNSYLSCSAKHFCIFA